MTNEIAKTLQLPASGYLRLAELIECLPFSRATLWRMVKASTFPKPLRLSTGVTAWDVADVHAWLLQLKKKQRV